MKIITFLLLASTWLLISCAITDEVESTAPEQVATKTKQAAPEVKKPKPKEVWICRQKRGSRSKVMVTATVGSEKSSVKNHVAGITYDAVYSVEDFNRRWDFGHKSPTEYRFIIEPDGDAAYYNNKYLFRRLSLTCKKK